MTKIHEYFQNLPVGEVVNKRGLAYLKRIGLIWDYSKCGYLECLHVYDKEFYSDMHYTFPNGNAKDAERLDGAMYEKWRQTSAQVDNLNEFREEFGRCSTIVSHGVQFDTKYFDGCFKPYLVKDGPVNGKQVNHRFAFPGGVC